MDNEYMALVVQLEDDLADFYGKLKSINRLSAAKEAFEYLRSESKQHSREIAEQQPAAPKPRFNAGLALEVINKAKASLWSGISQQTEYNAALDQLAAMEETVGKLYKSISSYLSNAAEYYSNLARTFEVISGEELKHRDTVLEKKLPS